MSVTRRELVLLALIGASGLILTACGQKGPLYLPEESEQDKDEDREKTSAPARSNPLRA